MNFRSKAGFLFVYLLASGAVNAVPSYKDELKALEASNSHEMVFNEDSSESLKSIARDIESFPKLNHFQRMILSSLELVLVTPETMPTLFGYIDGLCKTNDLKTPTIFIATQQGFFNALALKLLWGSGVVVIGKKIIIEAQQDELEGVLAHEIGHIKHDHGTKKFLLFVGCYVGSSLAVHMLTSNERLRLWVPAASPLVTNLIINKRFEKEADEFAYRTAGKGKGLARFFEHLEEKEHKSERDFDTTYAMLQDNKHNLAFFDYAGLLMRYYLAKGGHKIGNGFKWIYHNTFIGDHPSHQERIKTIQDHLANRA